jgi:tetratricopeptide (TPR) repeat protein
LNPSNSAAHIRYGSLLDILQRWDEAGNQILLAREQDPRGFETRAVLGEFYEHVSDLASAISVWEGLAKDFPDMEHVQHSLAWLYERVGRRKEATRLIEAVAGASDLHARLWRSAILILLGRPEEACAFLAAWERGEITERYIARHVASLYAMLGERSKALDLLEQDERTGGHAFWNVYLASELDSIRDDPRFLALLRAENLPTTLARPGGHPTSSPAVR